MTRFAIAGICAAILAAPLVAKAGELVLVNAAGQPVAILLPVAQPRMMPAALPMADIFAQQDAMMTRMMNDLRALQDAAFASPNPVMNAAPGSTLMVSSFSSGQGSCSRTISYEAQPGGAAPDRAHSADGKRVRRPSCTEPARDTACGSAGA